MPLSRPILLAALLAASQVAPPALASSFADTTAIDQAVAAFTGAAIGTPGGARAAVDSRLRLAPCHSGLALAWHGTRRDSVRVECPDAGGWRLFVSVQADGSTNAGRAGNTAAPLVRRGQNVTIALEGRGFSITQQGEALEAGRAGDWIRVRPGGKAEPVRAQVAQPGRVVIPLG